MIEDDNQFRITLHHLGRLLHGLDDLRENVLPKNAQLFSLLAESACVDIERLRIELEEYERTLKVVS